MDRLACVDLQTNAVPGDLQQMFALLRLFSPEVELQETRRAFWLSAVGLERLYASPKKWAEAICQRIIESGHEASVVVGFTRFGTAVLARTHRGILILRSPEHELEAVGQIPIDELEVPRKICVTLRRLGKRTIADLRSLPASGVLERFGTEVHRLRALAAGDVQMPLQPSPIEEPIAKRFELDLPEFNAMRLTFLAKRITAGLVGRVADRHQVVTKLILELELDHRGSLTEEIKPAYPTLDQALLIDLIRLRLEALDLPAGITSMGIEVETVPATFKQLSLFEKRPIRDPRAAARALARLRAEFGPEAVVRAVIEEAHLPEAGFTLRPVQTSSEKRTAETKVVSRESGMRTLVRRIFDHPIPLQVRPVVGPRGCHLQGLGEAPATRVTGPYIVSGGWWVRETHREYYFAETELGQILWVYFDKRRRCWFLHGEVE